MKKRPKRSGDSAYKQRTPRNINNYINEQLQKQEDLDNVTLGFLAEFYRYLDQARERKTAEIQAALFEARSFGLEGTYHRIVMADYERDPLCCIGSMKKMGGRFNFPESFPNYPKFPALYLGDSFETAYSEVFLRPLGSTGPLNNSEFALNPVGSFAYKRVTVKIDSYLDIRPDEALAPFLDIIAQIHPPIELQAKAKTLGFFPLKTINTLDLLKRVLFDENFRAIPTWLSMPSNSQWFGKYVADSGIQGILFPSVRSANGHNLAVFPRNFDGSAAEICLLDNSPGVFASRTRLTGNNFAFLELPAPAGDIH